MTQTISLGVDDVIQAVSEGFQLPMHLAKKFSCATEHWI